jgi:transcriptional regulator with XRE-family HTH domain
MFMSAFAKWLEHQLDLRSWSYNELARQAGVSSAGVSQVMTGRQKPGVGFCKGVAAALKIPADKVFRLAGLLPEVPERDERVDEILYYYDQMTPQMQENLRIIARAFLEASEQEGK